MAKKQADWSGAECYGVSVLAACLTEKLQNNILSLIGAAEDMLKVIERSPNSDEIVSLFRPIVEKARQELLSQL